MWNRHSTTTPISKVEGEKRMQGEGYISFMTDEDQRMKDNLTLGGGGEGS